MDAQELDGWLASWRVDDSVPPSFQRGVWRSIARGDREEPRLSPGALGDWLSDRLSRPRFAAAAVLGCIALSMVFAHFQAARLRSQVEGGLQARYVQSVDPFSAAAASPVTK